MMYEYEVNEGTAVSSLATLRCVPEGPVMSFGLCTKNLNLSSLCAFGAHTRSTEYP